MRRTLGPIERGDLRDAAAAVIDRTEAALCALPDDCEEARAVRRVSEGASAALWLSAAGCLDAQEMLPAVLLRRFAERSTDSRFVDAALRFCWLLERLSTPVFERLEAEIAPSQSARGRWN